MEHAHAAVALMALAAAFAAAAASHAHEEASRAAGGGQGGAAVHSHVSVGGGRPAVATLSVANAGHATVVSANATACGASGLLGRAAGDAEWSLRPGAAAAVSWAAPCAAGPVAVRVEYAMADGSTAASVHRACAGGAGSCGPGGAGGAGWAAGTPAPGRAGPDPAPAPAPAAAPTISSCTVSGLAATVCFNASASAGGGGRGSSGTYTVLRLLVPGPPGYAAVGTVAAPGSGGAACHADAAPANSETATYRVAAAAAAEEGGSGGSEPASPQSRPARAYFAAQQCYVGTPDGERIGSPRGPPAPRPAAQSDYRVAMYTGLASTPLTVQAHFGADIHVAERQQDGSWLRLGYDPSHPRGALSDHLPAERIGRGASGDADVRYVRADLLRHLDAFWGARQ